MIAMAVARAVKIVAHTKSVLIIELPLANTEPGFSLLAKSHTTGIPLARLVPSPKNLSHTAIAQ